MDYKDTRFIKGEVATLVVVGVLVVVGAAVLITSSLNANPKTTGSYAQASTCPYDSGQSIPLGGTETDANNAENRVPISQNRELYDSLASTTGFNQIEDEDVLTLSKSDGGAVDSGVENMMGSMFGYKPKRLIAAYDPPDGGTYVLEVPVNPNNRDIKMPSTGYDIGGGMEAMVVFAAADRVTLHIGRHEYFTGTKTCANGKTCSGGYWIYVKNICVDQQIQNAYNQVKGAQESAGANLNPIQLPMVRAGQILGKANGSSILVGVRDNGPFISIYKSDYWGGVPEIDVENGAGLQTPTSPPLGGSDPTTTPKQENCTNAKPINVNLLKRGNTIGCELSTNPPGATRMFCTLIDPTLTAEQAVVDAHFNNELKDPLFFSFTERGAKVKNGSSFRLVAWDQDHRVGDGSCTIEKNLNTDTVKSLFGYESVQPTSTPVMSPTKTPIPTQSLHKVFSPFLSGADEATPTPTSAPAIRFTVTVDVETNTSCVENVDEAISALVPRGVFCPETN